MALENLPATDPLFEDGRSVHALNNYSSSDSAEDAAVAVATPVIAPDSDWNDMDPTAHLVQFYETDSYLLSSLRSYVTAGLGAGDIVIVVASQEHRDGLETRLRAGALDVEALIATEQYIPLDAAETLGKLTRDGWPDPELFAEIVGGIIRRASRGGHHVRIFGEMVRLLSDQGKYAAAIELERLWNDLRKVHSFSLLCSYPMQGLHGEALHETLGDICAEHSVVIPTESFTALPSEDERLRAIALMQQRAHSLEFEIAERKAAAERFRFLAELMPQKIFTARPNGDVDYCNQQWIDFTGFPCDGIHAWGWARFLHPDDVQEHNVRWRHSIATGEPFQFEHRFRRTDGAYRWHLTRAQAMRDASDNVLLWIGSQTDIDEQKQREVALDRSIRLRDEFLAAISHDLKTPLTVLQGQAQVLQRRAARGTLDEAILLKALKQIESRSRSMNRLIDELLDVTLLRAGEELQLDRRPVDLLALAQDVIAAQELATHAHRLLLQSNEQQLVGRWDRARLERVLENLVNNAIKYSPEGGEISVDVARESAPSGDCAVLTVRDEGIGIAEFDLPHIFDPFYRGKNATSDISGTGLGLAGTRQIVEQHGGTIAVETAEQVGTSFTVRLPLDLVAEGAA